MVDQDLSDDCNSDRAWVILIAAYLGNIIFTTIFYSSGVIYVQLIRHFNDDVIKTSFVGAINTGLLCILGPVSAFAINRFYSRATCMFGGFLMAIACFTSAFTTSIDWLIVTYGIVGGVGNAFGGIPVAVVAGFNFNKKTRDLVLTLGSSMIGVGMLISSPMMTAILDYYGLRGAFLLLSGLSLQLCVLGSVFKPSPIEIQLKKQRDMSLRLEHDSNAGITAHCETRKNVFSLLVILDNLFHINILKVIAYDFFLFSTMAWNLMTAVCQMHLPNYMTLAGESPSQIALIMTSFGLSNTAGRLFGTLTLSQRSRIDLLFWHITLLFISGVAACTFPLYKTLQHSEIAFSLITGVCTGGTNSLLVPITLRLLGDEHLSSGYGMGFFFCGLGFLLGPPIASAFYRSSGGYDSSFIFAGSISIIGSISAVLAYLTVRKQAKETNDCIDENGSVILLEPLT